MKLETEGITVIRIGLMSSPSLLEPGQIVAGPWHPAFGFLVRSGIHHRIIGKDLPEPGRFKRIRIIAPKREIPLVRGYRNLGLRRIEKRTGTEIVDVVTGNSISAGRIAIEEI